MRQITQIKANTFSKLSYQKCGTGGSSLIMKRNMTLRTFDLHAV